MYAARANNRIQFEKLTEVDCWCSRALGGQLLEGCVSVWHVPSGIHCRLCIQRQPYAHSACDDRDRVSVVCLSQWFCTRFFLLFWSELIRAVHLADEFHKISRVYSPVGVWHVHVWPNLNWKIMSTETIANPKRKFYNSMDARRLHHCWHFNGLALECSDSLEPEPRNQMATEKCVKRMDANRCATVPASSAYTIWLVVSAFAFLCR